MHIPEPDPRQHLDPTTEKPLVEGKDPFALFSQWFQMASAQEPSDPNAMALATVGEDGFPDVRMVLLKGVEKGGFVFYTNLESQKGRDLAHHPHGALCFHWKSLARQVRVRGPVVPVDSAEADAYFETRPRGSRIGAWASAQSRPLESRGELVRQVLSHTARYAIGHIPRPSHWSGFRLLPQRFEFWQNGSFRLHDRLIFQRHPDTEIWETGRLYP